MFEGISTNVRNAVTIDTHRHGSVSEGHGNHYKRVPGRGVVRRQRGSAPSPSESPRYFAARMDESIIEDYADFARAMHSANVDQIVNIKLMRPSQGIYKEMSMDVNLTGAE
mgnify:CR=1 FL=1